MKPFRQNSGESIANTTVVPLRIDSVQITGFDTVYYLIQNIEPVLLKNSYYTCHDITGASLIGKTYQQIGNQIQLKNYRSQAIDIDL